MSAIQQGQRVEYTAPKASPVRGTVTDVSAAGLLIHFDGASNRPLPFRFAPGAGLKFLPTTQTEEATRS